MTEAERIIALLGLEPLQPEGGYFRRTWTSPDCDPGGRPAATAIYFLLTPDTFSALHRLDADEVWSFHAGDPVEHLQLSTGGFCGVAQLGASVVEGQLPQLVVPRGVWQGARLAPPSPAISRSRGWSLVGCTLSPGWCAESFELGKRNALIQSFPSWAGLIATLTAPGPA